MPKGKVASEVKKTVSEAVVQKAARAKNALLAAYEKARAKVDPTLLKTSRQFGAQNVVFKPAYQPEDLVMTWADVPAGDPVKDERFYRLLNEEGYVLMLPEHVADSYDEAVEDGLFYFRVKLDVVDVNGVDAVGFPGRGLVAMWRPKELAQQMYDASLARFKRHLAAESGKKKNMTMDVTEGRSTLGDVVAASEKDGG